MTTVVHHGKCLLVRVSVLVDPSLQCVENFLCFDPGKVSFLYDVEVSIEAVSLNVAAEHFHVLFDCFKVIPGDGISVVNVAKDEALAFVGCKVGQAGFDFA